MRVELANLPQSRVLQNGHPCILLLACRTILKFEAPLLGILSRLPVLQQFWPRAIPAAVDVVVRASVVLPTLSLMTHVRRR